MVKAAVAGDDQTQSKALRLDRHGYKIDGGTTDLRLSFPMKISLFLSCLLLAACASAPTGSAPPAADDPGYSRSPHEFRDEMLSPAR